MTFAGAMTTIETHLTAAGTACSPVITDIGCGDPGVPPGRCIRYWYLGDGEPARLGGARTLTDEMVGERLHVRAYWPVASRDKAIARALEVDVQALARQIKNRLIGDSSLGANCVDMRVGPANTGWLDLDGAKVRTLDIELVLDFVDVDTIAS